MHGLGHYDGLLLVMEVNIGGVGGGDEAVLLGRVESSITTTPAGRGGGGGRSGGGRRSGEAGERGAAVGALLST